MSSPVINMWRWNLIRSLTFRSLNFPISCLFWNIYSGCYKTLLYRLDTKNYLQIFRGCYQMHQGRCPRHSVGSEFRLNFFHFRTSKLPSELSINSAKFLGTPKKKFNGILQNFTSMSMSMFVFISMFMSMTLSMCA